MLELFAANLATTTVSSGGTTAPSSGTSESWTVASSAMFGAAATGVSQFHVADPALPSEMMTVTNVSGTTWTVTRGAETTTPVVHAAGFTVYQVVTTGWLGTVGTIGQGGTGQVTAAAAYNALSPMTAKGDMEYDSAASTAARLAIGSAGQSLQVSAGVPAWGMGLTLLASTGTTPYTLVNGTGTIISWTAPNDGVLHRAIAVATLHVTTGETAGQINFSFTAPDGTVKGATYDGGGHAAGVFIPNLGGVIVEANTTVSLLQQTALTAGAAVLWAEIWGS